MPKINKVEIDNVGTDNVEIAIAETFYCRFKVPGVYRIINQNAFPYVSAPALNAGQARTSYGKSAVGTRRD